MNEKKKALVVNGYIWAIFMMTQVYMLLFEAIFNLDRNTFLKLIALLIMGLIIIALFFEKKVYIYNVIVITLFTLVFILFLSLSNLKNVDYTIVQFGYYVLIPAYLVCQKFDIEFVLKDIIYLSFFVILGIEKILVIQNYGISQADMFNVYSMIPCILASIVHFIHFRDKSTFLLKIGYIINLYYLFRVGVNAVRGFWIVIICLFGMEILFWLQKKNAKKTYDILLSIGIALVIFILTNIKSILIWMIKFVQDTLKVSLGFFSKTAILLERGDLSNGRMELWKDSIKCFFSSPIIGNGIDGVKIWSRGRIAYPHNFIIQLLVDGGILFGLLSISIAIIGFYKMIYKHVLEKETLIAAIFLSSVSIPISMLSGDIWKSGSLWLTIFFYAKFITSRKVKI